MATMDTVNCAIWARVSTDEQSTANQLDALRALAATRGYRVTREFVLEESAWNGKQQAQLFKAQEAARLGEYSILLTWALDRLSRQGPEAMLRIFRQFGELGCRVISLQEPWTEVPAEVLPLLLSLTGWVAEQESRRRSERTKAGLARVAKIGHRPGRPVGSKDSKPRKRALATAN
jgi:DNA invertase Pin-like site-specific DNA recombinase